MFLPPRPATLESIEAGCGPAILKPMPAMRRSPNRHLCRLIFPVLFLACIAGSADAATPGLEAETLFIRRVAPLFNEKCLACHGNDEKKIKGGFDMRTMAGLLKGGESGKPSIAPGRPEQSPLYIAVTRKDEDMKMPPKEADKLAAEQVGWIKQWIAGGAPWPDAARVAEITRANSNKWSAEDGVVVKTAGGLSPEWTGRKYKQDGLWAYQPVKKPVPPVVKTQNPIDAFLAARMPAGLQPAPRADRTTLMRRATFDLTGLPPKPDEIDAFVADKDSDEKAFAKVVERLLASPHYGERMAQHWLDVVRYADSSGFANDYERGNAWRYRDYVVRAFNSDKPYDQFVREQIAGDELDPASPEKLIATGFLRMGPWELTGMEVAKIARQRFLDDVANSVGETFFAHSLQCARCHDHKFDPVPTRDYYSLQAVFATTQLSERPAAFLKEENAAGFEERRFLEARRGEYLAMLKQLDAKLVKNAERWFAEKNIDPAKWNAAIAQARDQAGADRGGRRREFGGVFDFARAAMVKQGEAEDRYPPKLVGFTPQDFGNERVARKGLERLKWELDRYEPFALSVYNGRTPDVKAVLAPVRMPASRMTDGELEETCVLIGGDPFSSGQKVKPGVLSVIGAVQKTPIPDAIEGRRKAFADWVASPENPLATRAIANRVWLWHFGQPIAGNPNNFGSTGKKPTHPELLDWLAATFVEQGWSFKAMHRLIMSSEAYRRSSVFSVQNSVASGAGAATKPALKTESLNTEYLAFKPRRLSAEELRDSMLAATGELNPTLGGIPNRPEINLEAALQPRMVMGTFANAWVPNPKPEQRHRRSIYALKIRGLRDPFMEVFNEPAPDFSCENREASTVTPQVFSLFNGRASYDRALALANRAVKETKSDDAALTLCFQLACGRRPGPDELAITLAHWRAMETKQKSVKLESPRPPLEVKREAVEENTGEKFTFNEKLEAYAEFVPDLQPSAVDARTRALADVCLALFNSNEFAYVY